MPAPDSHCVSDFVASPSHEPRAGCDLDMLVLHYTGMASGREALARLCDPASKVSAHYLVEEDGTIIKLIAESRRAFHAGLSSWRGATDINSRSIGIEIVNGGHDFGLPDFPARQIEAVIRLCKDIQSRWRIPAANILAHSDIAPSRKRDPGEKFPWRLLYDAGIGLWVSPEPLSEGPALRISDTGESVARLKGMLSDYGYGAGKDALFDETLRDVVMAFQRRFRPQLIDGIADASTVRTLGTLLEARTMAEKKATA